jgi:hypothetical protein
MGLGREGYGGVDRSRVEDSPMKGKNGAERRGVKPGMCAAHPKRRAVGGTKWCFACVGFHGYVGRVKAAGREIRPEIGRAIEDPVGRRAEAMKEVRRVRRHYANHCGGSRV